MTNTYRQLSFVSGEISPHLQMRVDIDKYYSGLKECTNFIVQKYGGVVNRSGFEFVAEITSDNVLLYPFRIREGEEFLLVFTPNELRVIYKGKFVTENNNVKIWNTPFDDAYFGSNKINITQNNNILIVTHYKNTYRITFNADTIDFVFDTVTYAPSIAPPNNVYIVMIPPLPDEYSEYVVTSYRDGEESYPSNIAIGVKTTNTNFNLISWQNNRDAEKYFIYKRTRTFYDGIDSGEYDAFGYIGVSFGTNFLDKNYTPDLSDAPPIITNMFEENNYPRLSTFFQQRLVLSGVNKRPATVYCSKTKFIYNFVGSTPIEDTDPVIFSLLADKAGRVKYILGMNRLLIFTDKGVWTADQSDSVFTPSSVMLQMYSNSGISDLPPIVADNVILYMEEKNSAIRALQYSYELGGYRSIEISIFASHLFEDYKFLSWGYQRTPFSCIWAVREDGCLIGLTFVSEHNVIGAHKHITDGKFKDICFVSEGNEDIMYCLIEREINGTKKLYLERMLSRKDKYVIEDDNLGNNFLDSMLIYDGTNKDSECYLELFEIGIVTDNFIGIRSNKNIFNNNIVGNQIWIKYQGKTYKFEVLELISSTEVKCKFIYNISLSMIGVSCYDFSIAVDKVSGLEHLEGKVVCVTGNGMVIYTAKDNKFVYNGKINIGVFSDKIRVGLPYVSKIETLNIDIQGLQSLVDKKKLVSSVYIQTHNTKGFYYGIDENNIRETKVKYDKDMYNKPHFLDKIVNVIVPSHWNNYGNIIIMQQDPVPVHILAIIPVLT